MQDHRPPTAPRLSLALALLALGSAPAIAAPGERPAQNRYVVMHMGGELGPLGLNGAFHIDAIGKRASYRSTVLEDGLVTSVWLFHSAYGSPGALRIGLSFDDGMGLPSESLPAASGAFRPTPGERQWAEIDLAQPLRVHRGDVVHVTIQPRTGPGATFGPNDYVDLISARSRFPVPYAPAPGSDSAPSADSTPYDPAATLLFDDGSGVGFVQLRGSNSSFQPVYLLETSDGRFLGQPYDRHIEYEIDGNLIYGQEVRFERTVAFDYVATFVRQATPFEPAGHLILKIYELDSSGHTTLRMQALVARNADYLYYQRSHWFGTYLEPGFVFQANTTYVLALTMSAEGPGYVFSTEHCSLPARIGLAPEAMPSYLGERSRAVVSNDDGQSFQPLRAPSDAAFLLGRYGVGRRTPIGVLDEISALTADDGDPATESVSYPYAACPGDVIGLSIVGRNIGFSQGPLGWPTLFALARDAETGAIVGQVDYLHVPRNLEVPGCLEVTMPDVPLWRLSLEVGHFGEGGLMIVDDTVPMEIRRAPDPCPSNLDFLDCSGQ